MKTPRFPRQRWIAANASRLAASLALAIPVYQASAGCPTLESGVYQTSADSKIHEQGDRVPEGSRLMPLSASLTFDLSDLKPSLTAVISNAVLEGGDPFPLTVRSSSGTRLEDGTYRFEGDYLGDLEPSGTQYLFEWRFSTSTDGRLVWNGFAGWAGGHIWQVAYSDISLVPDIRGLKLNIALASSQVTVSWPAIYAGYQLERAAGLPPASWTVVADSVTPTGDRLSVTIDIADSQGFFRLRKACGW